MTARPMFLALWMILNSSASASVELSLSSCSAWVLSSLSSGDLLSKAKEFVLHQVEEGRLTWEQVSSGPFDFWGDMRTLLSMRTLAGWMQSLHSEDRSRFDQWISAQKMQHEHTQVEREGVSRLNVFNFRMKFHKLTLKDIPPFGLMDVPVTKAMWWAVMQRPPANQSGFSPDDHPQTLVSADEMDEFIAMLQRRADAGDDLVIRMLGDHSPGDTYLLMRNRELSAIWEELSRTEGKRFFVPTQESTDADTWSEYAWFGESTALGEVPTSHLVAQKRPLLIQGKAFFDLIGNVSEIVEAEGFNWPAGPIDRFATWGGSIHMGAWNITSNTGERPSVFMPVEVSAWTFPSWWVGFRLIRRKAP